MDFQLDYLWLKAFHLIAMVAWFAGLFYLPRLFVYHADTPAGTPQSETFKIMERRLLRLITTPAMLLTWALGLAMLAQNPELMKSGWLHAKLTLVLLLSGYHGYLAVCTKKFANDANQRSAKFYRWLNEAPTLVLIAVIILAVVKPF